MRTEKRRDASTSQIQTPTGNVRTCLRASGFGPKRGILLYPGIRTEIVIYFGAPNRSCESFSYYAYGILLCLRTLTSTCLLTHVVSSPTPEINYYWFGYYLPDSHHMPLTDYYFTEAKITDTRSSGIPELRHTFEYINRSISMYFASSNIDLDSLLAFESLSTT